MSLNSSHKNLLALFVTVFAAVAAALTADNFHQEFNRQAIERDYLLRISNELLIGQDLINRQILDYKIAAESSSLLIEALEGDSQAADRSLLVKYFTESTRTGATQARINHDLVYADLVSTGQLDLISNLDLRLALSSYYRYEVQLKVNLERVPMNIWMRFRELTGSDASNFIRSWGSPDGDIANRLIEELTHDDSILRELRLLHSRLDFLTRFLQGTLSDNKNLVALIDETLISSETAGPEQ